MTQARRDGHSTEFGIWLRNQAELDSVKCQFSVSNVDYIWGRYIRGQKVSTEPWMLIEEKRYRNGMLKDYQIDMFERLHRNCVNDPTYRGFHKVVFQFTTPDDGWICLDNGDNVPERADGHITREEWISFLRFEAPASWYATRCIDPHTFTTITPTGIFSAVTVTPVVPFGRVITKHT